MITPRGNGIAWADDSAEPWCPCPHPTLSPSEEQHLIHGSRVPLLPLPFMAFGHLKTWSQPCWSDPNLGVWWPWPAPHPFLVLRATSVPFHRTPKWLVKLKHHLGVPFVFSGEVSEGLSLGLNLILCFPINWSVHAKRIAYTVNNEYIGNAKHETER